MLKLDLPVGHPAPWSNLAVNAFTVGLAIFFQGSGSAKFKSAGATSAESFRGHELGWTSATRALLIGTVTPDVLEELSLFGLLDGPEPKIVVVYDVPAGGVVFISDCEGKYPGADARIVEPVG